MYYYWLIGYFLINDSSAMIVEIGEDSTKMMNTMGINLVLFFIFDLVGGRFDYVNLVPYPKLEKHH